MTGRDAVAEILAVDQVGAATVAAKHLSGAVAASCIMLI